MKNTLTLAYSITSADSNCLAELLTSSEIVGSFEFELLIVIQTTDLNFETDLFNNFPNVKVLVMHQMGLSKSRNFALSNVDTKFAWLLDSDTIPNLNHVNIVLKELSDSPSSNLFLGKIKDTCSEKFYKKYSLIRYTKFVFINVSSIEMIVDVSFVKNNNILFNERLGLGTNRPSGEEACFVHDLIVKDSLIKIINAEIIRHPIFDPKRVARNMSVSIDIFKSKGNVCRYIGGFLGMTCLFYFVVRFSLFKFNLNNLKYILSGFFEKIK